MASPIIYPINKLLECSSYRAKPGLPEEVPVLIEQQKPAKEFGKRAYCLTCWNTLQLPQRDFCFFVEGSLQGWRAGTREGKMRGIEECESYKGQIKRFKKI